MQRNEGEYYQFPTPCVAIAGPLAFNTKVQKTLQKAFETSGSQASILISETPQLPKFIPKTNFFTACYAEDQTTLLPNLRFGILSLKWMTNFQKIKPSVLVLIHVVTENSTPNSITLLSEIYSQMEEYVRHNKTKILLLFVFQTGKMEEERIIVKSKFELFTKVIFVNVDRFDECLKEVESFSLNWSKKYYQLKVEKYKINLNIQMNMNLKIKEYTLRIYFKLVFHFIVIGTNLKAMKYLERANALSFEIATEYAKNANKSLYSNLDKDEYLLSVYYDLQKCEEALRLSNLAHLWILNLRFRDKSFGFQESMRMFQTQVSQLSSFKIWSQTDTPHYDMLSKLHLFRGFVFIFFEYLQVYEDLNIKSMIASLSKNILVLISQFLDQSKHKSSTPPDIESKHYGLLLEGEGIIADNGNTMTINASIIQLHRKYEENILEFFTMTKFISNSLTKITDHRLKNSININNLLTLKIFSFGEKVGLRLPSATSHTGKFINANKYALSILRETSPENLIIGLKKNIVENVHDQILIDEITNLGSIIGVSLNSGEFKLNSLFLKKKQSIYQEIELNLNITTEKTCLRKILDKICLKFNDSQCDSEFELADDNFSFTSDLKELQISLKQTLKTSQSLKKTDTLKILSIYFVYKDVIFYNFEEEISGLTDPKYMLTLEKNPPILLQTDFGDTPLLNNQYTALCLKLDRTSEIHSKFKFSDVKLKIKLNVAKDIVKSIKLIEFQAENNLDYKSQKDKIVQLNNDKLLKDESFNLENALENAQFEKNFYLKIKLARDSDIEIDFYIYANLGTQENPQMYQETIVFKKKLQIRLSFSITKTINPTLNRYIKKFEDADNELSLEMSALYMIMFNLKSHCKNLEIVSFDFASNEIIDIVEDVKSLTLPGMLDYMEETNLILIFLANQIFRKKNIGNLNVVWKTPTSSIYSKTSFKNLLIGESFEHPFDVTLKVPQTASYFERFEIGYSLINKSSEDERINLIVNSTDNVFVGGKINNLIELKKGETKTVMYDVVVNKVGLVKLPDLTILYSRSEVEKPIRYIVRISANLLVGYEKNT